MKPVGPDEGEGGPGTRQEASDQSQRGSDDRTIVSRLKDLRRRARGFPTRQQEVLEEALEQLAVALQGIQEVEEELRRQNEELSVTHTLLDAERRRYQELFDFAPEAYLVTDPNGSIEEVNRAASAMLGWRAKALLGKQLVEYVDPEDLERFQAHVQQLSAKRRRLQDWTIKLRTASGEPLLVSATVDAVRESDRRVASLRWLIHPAGGQAEPIDHLAKLAEASKAAAEAAATRLRKLQSITDVMLRHVGVEELLRGLLDAVREALGADTATILLLTPDGKNLAVRAVRGEDAGVPGEIRVPLGKGIAGRIASQRRPRIVPNVPAAGAYSQALRSRVKSLVGVPLVVGDRVVGVVHAGTFSPHSFSEDDVHLLELVAERAGVAIENATLYDSEQRARRLAELATERTAALQSVTAALAEALTPAEVAEVIVERGLAALSAAAGSIVLLSPDGSELVLVRAFGYPEEILEPWRRFPLESETPIAESARSGEAVFLGSPEEARRRFPATLGHAASASRAWAAIPLVVEGRTIGVMGLSFPEPRDFPEEERTFIQALGRQCAQALERARLYEAERSARAEAERAEDLLTFLAEASDVLASSLDIDITLASIARLAVPRLADWCTIDLLDEEGAIRQVAVSHRDPSTEPVARELRALYPPERDPPHPIWRVMLSGESELASEIKDRDLVARAKDATHVKMLRQLGIRSHIVVPLQARGRTLGVISFIRGQSGRTYGEEDLVLAEDLGRRAAVAIDNSGLYRAELTARQEAERAGVRLAFLSEATEDLSSQVPDYEAMLERVARLAVPVLADICIIDVLAEDGSIRRVAAPHADPAKEELLEKIRQHPPDPTQPHPVLSVLSTGEPRIIADVTAEMPASIARDQELRTLDDLGATSMLIVPLRARNRTLGAITLVATTPRHRYDEEDTELAQELARRAALVADNARLYDVQRNIAQTLQRSLLPGSLPEIPRMELAARYRAAGEGNEVGGDFYDAFEVDGSLLLAIGDVCGKGPEAAAVTGLARHTLRAVALHEPRPSRILATLNEAILRALGDQRFCTVCCLRVRPGPDGARLTMCSGGHPLPLILRANGDLETAGRPSMLLGVLPDVDLNDYALDVGPGDAVVLYTDGVIEQPREGSETGSSRLGRVLREHAGSDASTIAQAVERSVVEHAGDSLRDDIAVLVLRLTPESR